ncbi:hypothetical protein LTS15_001111 [Exophiala xenobiotica]|nr:hypothetical protein LTS15_001111 [Exophiala xenobiotica]
MHTQVLSSYNETSNEMRFHAVRDIKKGGKVLSCYERGYFDTAARRQGKLMAGTTFWERSDEMRSEMGRLVRDVLWLEKNFLETEVEEKADVVKEALEDLTRLDGLLLKEGLVGLPLMNVYRSLAKWSERLPGNVEGTVSWKTRELEVCTRGYCGFDRVRSHQGRVDVRLLQVHSVR